MNLRRFLIFLVKGALILAVFVFLTNAVIYLFSKAYIYKNIEDVKEAQTVLIPGAAVLSNGGLSPIFEDRVNTAIELYKIKKVQKILVSGDNSTISHNEVNPVRNYLLEKGVPDEDIFLDHAGFDTYSSMYRARDIFQVDSVIISTQSFHLSRAVFIARMLDLKAYGISADDGHILFKNYIREVFANEKAVFNLIFHTQPKYLGEVIPITGQGQNYGNPPVEVEEPKDIKVADGYVTGHVSIGPNCPVERIDQPCKTPPEAYSSREVIVYESDGATINKKGSIDKEGNYKIALAPGKYFIQVSPAGIRPGEKIPLTVKSLETTNVNFDIDTGIR